MIVFLILPDQLMFFFHSGPFAWNGLFGIWLPLSMFALWFIVNFWVMRRAILRERTAPALTDKPAGHYSAAAT